MDAATMNETMPGTTADTKTETMPETASSGADPHGAGANGTGANGTGANGAGTNGARANGTAPDHTTDKTAPRFRRDGMARPQVRDFFNRVRRSGEDEEDGAEYDVQNSTNDALDDVDDRDDVEAANDEMAKLPPVVYGRSLRKGLKKLGQPTDWDMAPPADGPKPDPLLLEFACDITEAPTAWLWPGRIPLEQVTLLAGDDDGSASLVARDLAARVSRCSPWPDDPEEQSDPQEQHDAAEFATDSQASSSSNGERPSPFAGASLRPGPDQPNSPAGQTPAAAPDPYYATGVLYCTPRYDRATKCAPGLNQAGGDMRRIRFLDGVMNTDGKGRRWSRRFSLPSHAENLRQAIDEMDDVRLIVLDPIEAFFDRHIGPREIVEAMRQLRDLAYDFGIAVVGVTRLKQRATRREVPEVAHPGLAAAASAVWGIVRAKDHRHEFRMTPIKMSVDGQGPPLVLTSIDDEAPGCLDWELAPECVEPDDDDELRTEVNRFFAADWLSKFLAKGPQHVKKVEKAAKAAGITITMLRKVYEDLMIQSKKIGLRGRHFWQLPDKADDVIRETGSSLNGGTSLDDSADISKVDPC